MLSKKTFAPFLISSLLLVSCSDSSSDTTSSNDLSGAFQNQQNSVEAANEKCMSFYNKAQYEDGASRIYIDPQTKSVTWTVKLNYYTNPQCWYNFAVFGKSTKVDWCKSPATDAGHGFVCEMPGRRFATVQFSNNNDSSYADPARYPIVLFQQLKGQEGVGRRVFEWVTD